MNTEKILTSIKGLSDEQYVNVLRNAFLREHRELSTLKKVADHNQKRLKLWKRESTTKSSNGVNEPAPTEDLQEFVEVFTKT